MSDFFLVSDGLQEIEQEMPMAVQLIALSTARLAFSEWSVK
jgi:hypothetical protein